VIISECAVVFSLSLSLNSPSKTERKKESEYLDKEGKQKKLREREKFNLRVLRKFIVHFSISRMSVFSLYFYLYLFTFNYDYTIWQKL